MQKASIAALSTFAIWSYHPKLLLYLQLMIPASSWFAYEASANCTGLLTPNQWLSEISACRKSHFFFHLSSIVSDLFLKGFMVIHIHHPCRVFYLFPWVICEAHWGLRWRRNLLVHLIWVIWLILNFSIELSLQTSPLPPCASSFLC